MADDDSSDLSSLLSMPDNLDEGDACDSSKLTHYFKKKMPAQARPKRPVSPAHDYVLADNFDIAFIVMFRSRFNQAFPKSLPNLGPKELEQDTVDHNLGDRAEQLLCAVLRLLLNRKQDVKSGHYRAALEEAISSRKKEWPKSWQEKSPLAGGATLSTMTPAQKLALLKTLIQWAFQSSEVLKDQIVNESYKPGRREGDLNQPLSVQPWGSESDDAQYFLIQGLEDTTFRIYRESGLARGKPDGSGRKWISVAGDIEEAKALSERLLSLGPEAKKLSMKITAAIPIFEESEKKRKMKEYRRQQNDRFRRPVEPSDSLYAGRTRGKRIKYNFDDDDDVTTDPINRRSATDTTNERTSPIRTARGRKVKMPARMTVDLNSHLITSNTEDVQGTGRASRSSRHTSKESSAGPTDRSRGAAAGKDGTNVWHSTGAGDPDFSNADGGGPSRKADRGDDEYHDPLGPEGKNGESDPGVGETVHADDLDKELKHGGRRKSYIVTLRISKAILSSLASRMLRHHGGTPLKSEETITAVGTKAESHLSLDNGSSELQE